MANITLEDSGYVSVAATGSVFTGDDIVNSGNAVELKGITLVYNRQSNQDETVAGDQDGSVVNPTSANNPSITITGTFMRGNLDGTGTDLAQCPLMDAMCVTKGVMCLYYNDTLTDTTGYPIITKWLGVTDSPPIASHPDEKHLHVRFKNFRVTQGVSNNYNFQMTGTLTK